MRTLVCLSAPRANVLRAITLAAGDAPPTEFRLFAAGENPTAKGVFVFDDVAAEAVMAAYRTHGVDLMIDLEHLSVAPEETTGDGRNFDPDARGWFCLELRNGELWAVNVRWTPDGARRLTERTQRYISPAFTTDEDGRVTEIFNAALTAIPATHDAPALVAASRKVSTMTVAQAIFLLARHFRAGKKLDEAALQTLAIDMKTLQAVVKAMGGDPAGDLGALMGAVQSFAKELADVASGKAAEEPPAKSGDAPASGDAGGAPAPGAAMASREHDELERLRKERDVALAAQAAELATLKAEKKARDDAERVQLVASLVKLGRETPATAWVNSDGKTPRGSLATMPLAELHERVTAFGGAPVTLTAPRPPAAGAITTPGGVEISEYEVQRVTIAAKRNKVDPDVALARYRAARTQQLNGAKTPADVKRFGSKIEAGHVLANAEGRFGSDEMRLLTSPVRPIETFGDASQRMLEEFNVSYMVDFGALPDDWTATLGSVLPGGSLKQTFPLDFSAVEYRERTAQNAEAETPQSVDISVSKREFRVAKQADVRRLNDGDFAYVHSWQQGAAQFARARVRLRAALVVALLEAGTTGYWGSSSTLATGIDGQPFFSATHKIHPFNPAVKMRGSATYSNYHAAAAPFNGSNLTAIKAEHLLVPHFDGLELQAEVSDLLLPTVLVEPARLLLTVQDLILDAAATLKSVSNAMGGGNRNEHFGSGLGRTWAPQLAGTAATTADWYAVSRAAIAMGFDPWVVAEDAAEEMLTWDQTSEFYKKTGLIKVESKLFTNATLLWPHAIRLVKGA